MIKNTAEKEDTALQQYRHHANWYHATTLTERLTSLRARSGENIPTPPPASDIAQQRLQRWKGQPPFNKETYFAQRLEADGLTENDLLILFGETSEAVQARSNTTPGWLNELIDAFTHYGTSTTPLLLPPTTEARTIAFLHTLRPLFLSGLARLEAGIAALSQQYSHLPFDPKTTIPLLFTQIPGLILPKLLRTLALELNVARVQGRLQGETPEERFGYFLQHLTRPSGMLPLLEEYAVLARQLVETIERWTTCGLELLERLCADWDEIRQTFFAQQDLGSLIEIQAGKGDTHRGGRSVCVLRWSSGARLVYKPRPMSIDTHFQALLSWLNTQGFSPAFRTLLVLNKGAYGWVEFVEERSCSSQEEVERFYQRQGGYLALLYALEAGDFHSENLIAAGEHPVLIDLEALFQPRLRVEETVKQEYPALETMDRSVLRTGLLPQRLWTSEEGEGVDVSGLGGQAGQLTPKPVATWTEVGTDQMHINRERVELLAGHHRPKLNGQDVDTLAYSQSIIAGFTAGYRLLLAHRSQLWQEILPRFAQDEIRSVLRPTQIYSLLLSDSFHPNVLREALDRDRLFDRLWADIEQRPYLARIIAAERADLLAGDVPVFTTYPTSHDIFTSRGACIANFFDRSAFDEVKARVESLDEQDLEKQIWIIQASFTSMTLGTDTATRRILTLHPSETEVTYARLLTAAHAIGDRLGKLALYSENMVGWLGVSPMNEREWHLLPTDADLYGGTSGIALFLGYLSILTGMERHSTLARQALNSARYQITQQKKRPGLGGVGAFNGIAGYIYLLSQLGTLWNEPALYQEAEELVALLPPIIADDSMFDVIGGAAGTIAALLSLHAVAPSKTILEAALKCGDHLIAHTRTMQAGVGWSIKGEETPLTGFAHGNAGIALNLLRLFAVSGEKRFHETALAALEYERSLYRPEIRNWPDLRKPAGSTAEQAYMVAWCHGAPGIGLARLGTLSILDDEPTRVEIEAALHTTIHEGFGINHSLCHGDLGNLDILLTANQVLKHPFYEELIQQRAAMLLDSIETRGWVTGIPQGVETPGLMVGIAGIGYALLRLASPEQVPSILLLAPPL
jgi:type 2 lantibiotic biosynthesis protein LanM